MLSDKINQISFFRKIAFAEGISFILLVFIAMPLKYFFNQPLAVKYIGWGHGLLFVMYVICLLIVAYKHKWHLLKVFLIFIAALLPFAPFIVDKYLQKR